MLNPRPACFPLARPPSSSASWCVAGVVGLGLYVLLYAAVFRTLGVAASMTGIVPTLATAWLGGARSGLAMGVMVSCFHALFSVWALGSDELSLFVRSFMAVSLGVVGWVVGSSREARFALENELTERERLALELTRTYAELEDKVAERTSALTLANRVLRAEITERREARDAETRLLEQHLTLERQLFKAQKMEALGRLAGGVAHDFNNLLTAIIGFAELARSHAGVQQTSSIEQIHKAALRASELTRGLLAFARHEPSDATPIDVAQIVSGAECLLRRLIGEDIKLSLELGAGSWLVKIDAAQLEQVIVNLAVNARDAMPSGGTLRIGIDNVRDRSRELVRIHVRDTGIGMDDATASRLFEPFFTTKPEGEGTGLGLATSYGIISQAGGEIRVRSKLGSGTVFEIDLPRALERASERRTKDPVSGCMPRSRGRERVLVVEDEPLVREFIEVSLLDQGYRVLTAETPRRAAELAREFHDIELLLTDIIMPEKNGSELAREVQALLPQVAVLYVSGYARETIRERGVLNADDVLLEKPFGSTALVSKVRETLEQKRRGALAKPA